MVAKRFKKVKNANFTQKVTTAAGSFQSTSGEHVNKYLKKRAKNIFGVRRFMLSWLVLIVLLAGMTLVGYIQLRRNTLVNIPEPGGVYTEGMVGEVTSLNPLFANGSVDDSASKLIFNGLLRYDTRGRLQADLAQKWEVSGDGRVYVVDLRQDVAWHDQQPFTSEDVIHTIEIIQDPQTRSGLFTNWKGVKVSARGKYQVVFELPAAFAPFLGSLTVPILPSHLLKETQPARLRTAAFNTAPIGTGPFQFQALRSGASSNRQVEFTRNTNYYRQTPLVERFVLRLYDKPSALSAALRAREITAAVDLSNDNLKGLKTDDSIRLQTIPLNSGVFAFFKTTATNLKQPSIRQALAYGLDRQNILQLFEARYAPLKTPLLPTQLGYDKKFGQQTNKPRARQLLDKAGWRLNESGVRQKAGKTLEFSLVTVDSPEYRKVAENLKQQWTQLGVIITPEYLTPDQLQQTAISAHLYDILLYGISIGSDPDVYAYWHSSQAKVGGVNFSEWRSSLADSSLDIGRTRFDDVLRIARYKAFQKEWQASAPAAALYQPRVNYAYHQNAHGFVSFAVNTPAERLSNVEQWTVNTRPVAKTP